MTEAIPVDGLDQNELQIGFGDSPSHSDDNPINLAGAIFPSPGGPGRGDAEEEEESLNEPRDRATSDQHEFNMYPYHSQADDLFARGEYSEVPHKISEHPFAESPQPETSAEQPPPEPIPEETPLDRLQRQQQEAINAFDFQLARDIQTRIDTLTTAGTFSLIDEKSAELRRALNRLAITWRRTRDQLTHSFHDLEVNERTRADSDFEHLKSRHLLELTDLKSRLFDEYKREITKPIAKYEDLLGQARGNAVRADFDRAQKNQEDAERVLNEQRSRREITFRKSYKSQLRFVLARQGGEVESLAKRIRDTVGDLEKRREKEIRDETLMFRRKLDREYKRNVDAVANRARASPRKTLSGPVVTDRRVVTEILNALEETFKAALIRYGLAPREEATRPRPTVPRTKIESSISIRMQSKIAAREQPKTTAHPHKFDKREPWSVRSSPRSKARE
jgi:hypothetical protein